MTQKITGERAQRRAFRMVGSLEHPDTARLWDYGCTGVVEEGPEVVAYFDAPVDLPFEGRWEAVDPTDWVAEYHRTLTPVPLGRLVVAPTHHQVNLSAGQRALWLDPGMAFGSGHHETTQLALAALEALELRGKRVLDVGAGSGILAIAADLLGAGDAEGLDIDPETVPVAEANARLNLSRARFSLGTLGEAFAPADVLVANLFAELHAELAPHYLRALKPGGLLLATGILEARAAVAADALFAHFGEVELERRGEWLLLRAHRPETA
jgi:ribosomal protein L11 methyltransferase